MSKRSCEENSSVDTWTTIYKGYSSKRVRLFLRFAHASFVSLDGSADGDLEDYVFFGWTHWTNTFLVGLLGYVVENVVRARVFTS